MGRRAFRNPDKESESRRSAEMRGSEALLSLLRWCCFAAADVTVVRRTFLEQCSDKQGFLPQAADKLSKCEIDSGPRGKTKASDHTPVWCELAA